MADQEKKVILTREGYEKLEKELDYYISVRRNEISEQIAIARGFGDLSENAEYDEAKNEQSRIEAKIVEMENTLRNCVVVEDDEVSTDVIGVGNTVKVQNLTMKIEQTITIVGANETDPSWLHRRSVRRKKQQRKLWYHGHRSGSGRLLRTVGHAEYLPGGRSLWTVLPRCSRFRSCRLCTYLCISFFHQ